MRPVPAIPPPAGALSPARPRRRRPPAVACDANASRPVSAVAWRAYRRAELLLARQAWPAGSRRLLAAARRRLAAEMGVSPGEVEVCSGGTEANAWALDVAMATIRAAWRGDGAPQVLVSALEHPAVADGVRRLASLYAFDVGVVLPAPDGRVPAAAFAAALTPATALCCLMMAHNETGAVQPVAAAVAACRALCSLRGQAPPRWHSDAVQAASSLPLRPAEMGVDSLAFAGHKLGAVGGVGCLVLRGPRLPPPAWRGGIGPVSPLGSAAVACRTSDAADDPDDELSASAAWAMAAALSSIGRQPSGSAALAASRDALEADLRARLPQLQVVGETSPRLPHTSCIRLPGCPADGLMMALDLAGFCTSTGSACASGAIEASVSLLAMGFSPADASEVLRISLNAPLTPGAHCRLVEQLAACVSRL